MIMPLQSHLTFTYAVLQACTTDSGKQLQSYKNLSDDKCGGTKRMFQWTNSCALSGLLPCDTATCLSCIVATFVGSHLRFQAVPSKAPCV
jgi:hypothetical protein